MNIPIKLDSVQTEKLKVAMIKNKKSFNQNEVTKFLLQLIEDKYEKC